MLPYLSANSPIRSDHLPGEYVREAQLTAATPRTSNWQHCGVSSAGHRDAGPWRVSKIGLAVATAARARTRNCMLMK